MQVPVGFLVLFEQCTSEELQRWGILTCLFYTRLCGEGGVVRDGTWVHPINIKRPEFGIFSHLYPDLLEDEEKFRGFFRMNIEQFYHLSQ